MPERGPGIDFNSYESKITIGKVEKTVEQKIVQTTEKIANSGVFDQNLPEHERNRQADEIVASFGHGFETYIDIVQTIQKPEASVTEDQRNNAKEDFEVLSKSICLVMNSGRDQELQTRLNLGSEKVLEVLPKNWQTEEGLSDIVLAESVVDKSITNPEVRGVVKKLDKIRKRCDINNPNDKQILRKQVEETVGKLILMDVDDKDEDQLMTAKSYLNTEAQGLAKVDGIKPDDGIEPSDAKVFMGGLVEALSRNTEATQGNTEATEGNTEAVLDLNSALEGFTTVVKMETLTKLKIQGVDGAADLTAEMISNLEKEANDPSLYEIKTDDDEGVIKDKLLRRQKATELHAELKYAKAIQLIEKEALTNPDLVPPGTGKREREVPGNREDWNGSIDQLYQWLDSIENGTRSVDDLSTNSTKFGYLYRAQNGDFDDYFKKGFKGEGGLWKGERLTSEQLETMKAEVSMRLFLHSLHMAASKCSSIEDIMRVVSSMHEGDIDDSLDKLLLSTFLNKDRKGTGLENIPVDTAWNLRQDGYFRFEDIFNQISGDKQFRYFLENIPEKDNPEAYASYQKIIKNGGFDKILGKLFNKGEPEIPPSVQYGIDEPVYQNWFGIEKGGKVESKLVEEYMVWKIMQKDKCGQKNARKAFDLAHKLSVATFMDSAANLAFAQDDYAEIINFKFLRYCDGPGGKEGRRSKSKAIGSPNTISYVNSLTCHWMYLLRPENEELTTAYTPLYVKDIDLNLYKSTTAMPYHFFGVVGSQVEFVKQSFFEKYTQKEVMSTNFINKIFSKINKTAYDMCRARIKPIYSKDESFYTGLNYKDKSESGKKKNAQIEARVSEKLRKAWVMNVFRMAALPESGWTMESITDFINTLSYNSTILDGGERISKDGIKWHENVKGTSFISKEELDGAVKVTRVKEYVMSNDRTRRHNRG